LAQESVLTFACGLERPHTTRYVNSQKLIDIECLRDSKGPSNNLKYIEPSDKRSRNDLVASQQMLTANDNDNDNDNDERKFTVSPSNQIAPTPTPTPTPTNGASPAVSSPTNKNVDLDNVSPHNFTSAEINARMASLPDSTELLISDDTKYLNDNRELDDHSYTSLLMHRTDEQQQQQQQPSSTENNVKLFSTAEIVECAPKSLVENNDEQESNDCKETREPEQPHSAQPINVRYAIAKTETLKYSLLPLIGVVLSLLLMIGISTDTTASRRDCYANFVPAWFARKSAATALHHHQRDQQRQDTGKTITLREYLTHPDGFHLAMAPAFFGFYAYFGALITLDEEVGILACQTKAAKTSCNNGGRLLC